jgi:hypothetical protein
MICSKSPPHLRQKKAIPLGREAGWFEPLVLKSFEQQKNLEPLTGIYLQIFLFSL